MFNDEPKGSITPRKLRKLFPFIQNRDMAQSLIDLAWALLLALVPLMVTTQFPKAIKILWDAMEQIEQLYNTDPTPSEFEAEVEAVKALINAKNNSLDGEE